MSGAGIKEGAAIGTLPRVLFIDDGDLIEKHGLDRVIHPAHKHENNPVVVADRPWENHLIMGGTVRREAGRYRMWYQSYGRGTMINLYAESPDGIASAIAVPCSSWVRPANGTAPR